MAVDNVSSVSVPAGPLGLQGRARDINSYINRAPDTRLNSILKKTGSALRLGIIQQTDDVAAANGQAQPYACRFHFNPPTIGVTYQVATGVLPVSQLTTDQAAALAIYPGQTQLAWDLFFDRTYEVNYGPGQANPTDLREIGVYHDIQALENVVGVSNSAKYSVQTSAADGTSKSNDQNLMGNMLMIPVYVLFGGGSGGTGRRANTGLAYVGFLTSMNVTYTLFSSNMVPTRATVSLSFQQLVGRGARDYQKAGGTVIDRAHAVGRTTTSSGQNVANAPRVRPGGL